MPHRHRTLQKEIRWRPPKHRNRLPRGLVQVGDALATREAYPDSPMALGTRNADLPAGWSLLTTPSPKLHDPRSARVRAPRALDEFGRASRVWPGRLKCMPSQAPRTTHCALDPPFRTIGSDHPAYTILPYQTSCAAALPAPCPSPRRPSIVSNPAYGALPLEYSAAIPCLPPRHTANTKSMDIREKRRMLGVHVPVSI